MGIYQRALAGEALSGEDAKVFAEQHRQQMETLGACGAEIVMLRRAGNLLADIVERKDNPDINPVSIVRAINALREGPGDASN